MREREVKSRFLIPGFAMDAPKAKFATHTRGRQGACSADPQVVGPGIRIFAQNFRQSVSVTSRGGGRHMPMGWTQRLDCTGRKIVTTLWPGAR